MDKHSQDDALISAMDKNGFLLMDGATGTNLFDMGLVSGDAPELWNDEYPDRVLKLNAGFAQAGSDVILTNSFGCNAMRLKLHSAQHRVSELNEKASAIALQAAESTDRDVFVAGSMGPLGELIEPVGTLSMEDAIEAFSEQALALERGGCQILWIETISSEQELVAAATAAARTALPFACNASFDTHGRTMMGISPAGFAEICNGLDKKPFAVGSNCGIGPAQTVAAVYEMTQAHQGTFSFVAKANCGIPVWEGTSIRYTATPEQMYIYAQVARATGASIIGGCCGTQFEHVRFMRKALDEYVFADKPTLPEITEKLGSVFKTDQSKEGSRKSRRRR